MVNNVFENEYIFLEVLYGIYHNEIRGLENKVNNYPQGTVVFKTINGKKRAYLQWRENGKTKSKYIKDDEIEEIKKNVEERQICEKRLKELKKLTGSTVTKSVATNISFDTNIYTGNKLIAATYPVIEYKKRYCYSYLRKFLGR